MLETLVQQALGNSALELAAVVLAIAYLLLAVRENSLCWIMAAGSTAIYFFVFLDAKYYMETALQVFYFGMAIYGWYEWRYGGQGGDGVPISTWTGRQHGAALLAIALATGTSTWLLSTFTDAHLPLIDSFTTWSAVVTTFMVARKVLENWIYWFVIDAVSIYLYLDRALYFTSALFAIYLIIILFGFAAWLKTWRAQQASV